MAAATMLDFALDYLSRGLPVFPVCRPIPMKEGWCVQHGDHETANAKRAVGGRQPLADPGKHPLISWGEFQRRLPTPDEVSEWWTRWPDANIGMITGSLSGRVVLDSDGFDAYTAVLSRGGVEPTPTVITGKPNGFHWYLKHPGRPVRNFAGDRGVEGLDFRGDGGYVVLPPSLHRTGAFYTWHGETELDDPKPVPSWLLELLTDGMRANGTEAPTAQTPIDIEGVLRGVPEGQRDDTLYRTACRLRSDNVPIEYAELLIRGAARNCNPPFSEQIAVLKVHEAYKRFQPTIVLGSGAQEPPTSISRDRFRLFTPTEMKDRQPPTSLIDGILFRDSLTSMSGVQGTFKSFIALDMALSIAAGLQWQGRDTHQGPTLYISAEGTSGLKWRIEAWEIGRQCSAPDTCLFLPEAVQFLQAGDVDAVIGLLANLPELPVLIVTDTLARTMVGGDENSARDMGIYISSSDRIRVATNATVLFLHHVARAGGNIRGSTALPGALDTMLDVTRDGQMVTLTCGKQKDAEEFEEINLMQRIIDISEGNHSLVFDLTTRTPGLLSEMTRKVGLILFETFGEDGATATQWQQVSEDAKVSRATFFRAKQELIKNGTVQAQSIGRSSRFVAVDIAKVSRSHEGLTGSHETDREIGLKVSHSFRSETLRPNGETNAETNSPQTDSCGVCGAQNWRPLNDGWVCATCFPDGQDR